MKNTREAPIQFVKIGICCGRCWPSSKIIYKFITALIYGKWKVVREVPPRQRISESSPTKRNKESGRLLALNHRLERLILEHTRVILTMGASSPACQVPSGETTFCLSCEPILETRRTNCHLSRAVLPLAAFWFSSWRDMADLQSATKSGSFLSSSFKVPWKNQWENLQKMELYAYAVTIYFFATEVIVNEKLKLLAIKQRKRIHERLSANFLAKVFHFKIV